MNQELINEIRQKSDIVDVIGERIPLVARGKNYFGVCPFHDDTNPSMSVSREKQIYTCFSCHATGNVFTFLMNYEHKEFQEVVKELADRAGIEVQGLKQKRISTKYDEWYQAYDLAMKYYQNNLMSSKGKKAREYLEKRSINYDIIKEFELGFSLDEKDQLTKFLTGKNYSIDLLNKAGLTNEFHDIFHNRLMFPLHDLTGHVVGFSGRLIVKSEQNKYLNTKETEIFKKGNLLYHYHIAKQEARKEKYVIIMEGFMDIIRASTIGVKSTVATMGTALTKDHIGSIKRLSNNIILCFDGDEAGKKATMAAGTLFEEANIEVKVISLPEEDDPDTFILNHEKESFYSLIENAIYFSDYKIKALQKDVNMNSSEEKADYINKVLLETAKIKDPIRVEIILKDLAKNYEISYNTLEKSFRTVQEAQQIKKEKVVMPSQVVTPKVTLDKYQKASLIIFYYMLEKTWVIDMVSKSKIVFPKEEYRALASAIESFYQKNGFINQADFYTYLGNNEKLLQIFSQMEALTLKDEITEKEMREYFKVLDQYRVEKTIQQLETRLKDEVDPLEKAKIVEQIRQVRIGEEK